MDCSGGTNYGIANTTVFMGHGGTLFHAPLSVKGKTSASRTTRP